MNKYTSNATWLFENKFRYSSGSEIVKPLLLIIGSNAEIEKSLALIFETIGNLRCRIAPSMPDALQMMWEEPPDIVITDDLLKDGNGCELCRQMRYNPKLRAIPVIMFAGHEVPAERLDAAGIDLFLLMPTPPEVLLQHISTLLANYEAFKKAAGEGREKLG